jgi:cysteine desulfurase/selenocysteine lyase
MIYFNNAATSYPKPDAVIDAMREELTRPPANPHRDHVDFPSADRRCRTRLAEFFNVPDSSRIILCSGGTEALNLAINGLIKSHAHVITTSLEHNAVLRPLYHLETQGRIDLDILPLNISRGISPDDLVAAIRPETTLVVVNHASNVTGVVVDLEQIYEICHSRNIPLLIDASQSAGSVMLNVADMPGAVIAFTGHKSLLGPPGTGGLVVGAEMDLRLWKLGGTGIHSEYKSMPNIWPEKYEPGTMNHPGLAGLAAALDYILERGLFFFTEKKNFLAQRLENGLAGIPGVTIYAPTIGQNPCGVVGFTLAGQDIKEVGYILRESFDIRVRTGLHCAPLIHRALGTYPDGTIRVSLSVFNTSAEVDQLLEAVTAILGDQ